MKLSTGAVPEMLQRASTWKALMISVGQFALRAGKNGIVAAAPEHVRERCGFREMVEIIDLYRPTDPKGKVAYANAYLRTGRSTNLNLLTPEFKFGVPLGHRRKYEHISPADSTLPDDR
jgi:hypothetical protein